MLQNMRDNLKGIGIVIVAAISIPFIFTGAGNFFTGGGAEPEVSEVNGVPITARDISREMLQSRQLLEQYGDSIRGLLEQQILNQLTRNIVLETAAKAGGMTVARQTITSMIKDNKAFQQDGDFDNEVFRLVLTQNGYDSKSYYEKLQRNLVVDQFVQGVLASEFVTDNELAQSAAVAEQRRNFYYLTVPVEPLLEGLTIDDETLQARYEESKDQLVVPEQVVVEYIELNLDTLKSSLQVEEAKIRERFDEELQQAKENTQLQRRLAHILVNDSDDQSHEAIIAEIQGKLDAGESFADLAKTYSQDSGTANLGGDLGFIDLTALPQELAAAAEALELNGLSAPIKSDSGYHLIKVTDLQQQALPTYDGRKEQIAEDLKLELAEEQYAVALEALKDTTYNIFGDASLQEAADTLGLEMKVSEPFTREGGVGVAADPRVAAAAFSDNVLNKKLSSDAQELTDNKAVVVKLREHIAERTKALDEVRETLIAELKREQARELAKAKGESLLARVIAGETVEQVAKAESLEWQVSLDTKRAGGNVDAAARSKAFTMAVPTGKPVVEGLVNSDGNYLLVELTSVQYPKLEKLPDAQQRSLAGSLKKTAGERSMSVYQSSLLEQADIDR